MSDVNPFEAIVVAIPTSEGFLSVEGQEADDVWRAVLNVGARHDIVVGSRFVLFALGPELKDPGSGESLGHYEIVRGRGRVTHVQETMCTVSSERTVRRAIPGIIALGGRDSDDHYYDESVPFSQLRVGDFARLIG